MLKKRIIPVLFIKQSIVVQSIFFKLYRPVGCPRITVEFLNRWGADEIIIIDLDAAHGISAINSDLISDMVKHSDVPLSYGGGLRSLEDVDSVFRSGVDKVIFNQALESNKSLVLEVIDRYGSQAVIGSFDIKYDEKGWKIYNYKDRCSMPELSIYNSVSQLGLGEVFVNVVDRDGSRKGYDLPLCQELSQKLTVPLIFGGGCFNATDMADLFFACPELSAAAAGNFFHFTELSVRNVKTQLSKNFPIRLPY